MHTPTFSPLVNFKVEDVFCRQHTVKVNQPLRQVQTMFKLNEQLIADKKKGTVKHEFNKHETDLMCAVEFICYN